MLLLSCLSPSIFLPMSWNILRFFRSSSCCLRRSSVSCSLRLMASASRSALDKNLGCNRNKCLENTTAVEGICINIQTNLFTLDSASSAAFFFASSSSRERGCTWKCRNNVKKVCSMQHSNLKWLLIEHLLFLLIFLLFFPILLPLYFQILGFRRSAPGRKQQTLYNWVLKSSWNQHW